MAAVLSERGLKVVVLEAGGYFDEADFNQLEISAYQNLYWRGGPSPTAEMNVSLQAGFCLGGGTVVNWTNSLRTTPWVREQREREYGLEGLAGADFDRHLDAVWERLSVTDRCSELNGSQQRMKAGAETLAWSSKTVQRNTDERRSSFETAGYIGFGDQTGAKQSTVKTYLQDAYDLGAGRMSLVRVGLADWAGGGRGVGDGARVCRSSSTVHADGRPLGALGECSESAYLQPRRGEGIEPCKRGAAALPVLRNVPSCANPLDISSFGRFSLVNS